MAIDVPMQRFNLAGNPSRLTAIGKYEYFVLASKCGKNKEVGIRTPAEDQYLDSVSNGLLQR